MKKLVTKTLLTSGQNAYALNVRMLITRDVFGRALSEESFAYGDISFATLSKKRAIELLNKRLRFHGSEGEFQGLDDMGDRQDEELKKDIAEAFYDVSVFVPPVLQENGWDSSDFEPDTEEAEKTMFVIAQAYAAKAVRDALVEERERLIKQCRLLKEKSDNYCQEETIRIKGKIQGVKLAIENIRQSLLKYEDETGA